MKVLLVVFLALVLCATALADATWHSSTIRTVYPLADGSVILTFATDSPTCTSPSNPDYYHVGIGNNGMTADGLKNILAAALTAAASGKRVTINYDNATT